MNRELFRAYFYNEASAEEQEVVTAWLAEPDNEPQASLWMREIFDEINATESPLSRRKFKEFCDTVGLDSKAASGRTSTLRRMMPLFERVAAILLLPVLACLIAFYATSKGEVQWQECYVAYGDMGELVLPDGTHLNINAGTHVYYPSRFEGGERKIFVNGEIFASVKSDKEHPFVIESGDVNVRVTGTKFNFRSYSADRLAQLVLTEGGVVFSDSKEQQYTLKPGEAISYDRRTHSAEKLSFNTHLYRSFAEGGSTCFLNQPFGEIIAQLERLFDCKIVLLDEQLANERYLAYFTNNESLHDILRSLNINGEMNIRSAGNIIYIQSAEH